MIRFPSYISCRDIDIVETGLQLGEKLYEELPITNRDIEQTKIVRFSSNINRRSHLQS